MVCLETGRCCPSGVRGDEVDAAARLRRRALQLLADQRSAFPGSASRLVAGWPREGVDERAGTRRVVPHLKRGVEVEDERRRETAAGAVDREHGVAVDFVEVDVLEHGASPVREVEEVDARLIRINAGL